MTQDILPTYTMAQLIIGPNAPADETQIITQFEYLSLPLPDDFVITPFDYRVLGLIASAPSRGKVPIVTSIANDLEIQFQKMGYVVTIPPYDINAYLQAMRGNMPGRARTEDRTVLSRNLPEVRERYNALCDIQMLSESRKRGRDDSPNYKLDIQHAVAQYLIAGKTTDEIAEDLGIPQVHSVVDMMLLDMLEITEYADPLSGQLLDVAKTYLNDHPNSKIAEEYISQISSGKPMYKAHSSLAIHMNPAIANQWLSMYAIHKESMNMHDMRYVRRAITEFIKGGSSRLCEWSTSKRFRKLGRANNPQLGAYIVRTSLGYDFQEWSVIDVMDNIYEAMTTPGTPLYRQPSQIDRLKEIGGSSNREP